MICAVDSPLTVSPWMPLEEILFPEIEIFLVLFPVTEIPVRLLLFIFALLLTWISELLLMVIPFSLLLLIFALDATLPPVTPVRIIPLSLLLLTEELDSTLPPVTPDMTIPLFLLDVTLFLTASTLEHLEK